MTENSYIEIAQLAKNLHCKKKWLVNYCKRKYRVQKFDNKDCLHCDAVMSVSNDVFSLQARASLRAGEKLKKQIEKRLAKEAKKIG